MLHVVQYTRACVLQHQANSQPKFVTAQESTRPKTPRLTSGAPYAPLLTSSPAGAFQHELRVLKKSGIEPSTATFTRIRSECSGPPRTVRRNTARAPRRRTRTRKRKWTQRLCSQVSVSNEQWSIAASIVILKLLAYYWIVSLPERYGELELVIIG